MILWHLGSDRAEEWRAIRLRALREAPEAFDSKIDDWANRPLADFAQRLAEGRVFAAGDQMGEPLAIASWDAGLDPDHPDRAWVMSVFCAPEARGRGLARAVIRAVLDDATEAGQRSAGLNVLATNAPAIRLYESLGFRDSGRIGVSNAHGAEEREMIRPLPVVQPLVSARSVAIWSAVRKPVARSP